MHIQSKARNMDYITFTWNVLYKTENHFDYTVLFLPKYTKQP